MNTISFLLLTPLAAPIAPLAFQDVDASTSPQSRSFQAGPQLVGPTTSALASGSASVIFTNLAASSTSDVPGLPGAKFTGASVSAAFERPWVSSNGLHWIISADTGLATTEDEVVLVNGVVVEREGTVPPFAPAELYGLFDARFGINNTGEYAFFNNMAGTTPNDDYVVKVTTGPTYTIVARESLSIPALPASTFDDDLEGVVLLNNGDVALAADLIDGGGITTATDELLLLGSTIVAQEGITIPTGQAASGVAAWDNFSFEDQWFDNAGNVLIKGDLLGATTDDDVVVYNNAVVLQENQIIPGSGFVNPIDGTGIVEVGMDHGGNWYARGNNDTTEQDWVVRNGVLIATEQTNVYPAPGRYRVLTATLDGAQEVPPVVTTGAGTALVTVDTLLNTLTYTITFTGLTSAESLSGNAPTKAKSGGGGGGARLRVATARRTGPLPRLAADQFCVRPRCPSPSGFSPRALVFNRFQAGAGFAARRRIARMTS